MQVHSTCKNSTTFSRFYISMTIQANLDIDTFKCLLHVWQSVSWLWHFLLDLIHSREKQLCICMHKKVNIWQFKFWSSTFRSILWPFDCTTERPFWPPKSFFYLKNYPNYYNFVFVGEYQFRSPPFVKTFLDNFNFKDNLFLKWCHQKVIFAGLITSTENDQNNFQLNVE